MGETIGKCECGLFTANGLCPRCDEIAYDLLEEQLAELGVVSNVA